MRILVTGGTGYIGSHTVVELSEAGYDVLIADNYSNSKPSVLTRLRSMCPNKVDFMFCDLRDKTSTDALFAEGDIEAVIHFAGLKAVGESTQLPLKYYENNLFSSINLMQSMREHNVKKIVFSSSATVYGDPETLPMREDFPLKSMNPYGSTKRMTEEIMEDVYKSDTEWHIALLRYFNPIGAHPSGIIGEDPNGIPNNLLPYVAKVAIGALPALNVFGNDYDTRDGTGVRDYLHVVDLSRGHIKALEKLEVGAGVYTYNLGTGLGYSVLEVVKSFEKACGKEIPLVFTPRREGDLPEYYADPSLAETELKWKAQYNLDDMCRDAWNFQSKNPNGYPDED